MNAFFLMLKSQQQFEDRQEKHVKLLHGHLSSKYLVSYLLHRKNFFLRQHKKGAA